MYTNDGNMARPVSGEPFLPFRVRWRTPQVQSEEVAAPPEARIRVAVKELKLSYHTGIGFGEV